MTIGVLLAPMQPVCWSAMRTWQDRARFAVMLVAPWERWRRRSGATILAVAALVAVAIAAMLWSPVLWDTCACSILTA